MASRTFNYPELQKVVDIAYSQALQREDSIPSAVAFAIWCWIEDKDEITDHASVSAGTTSVDPDDRTWKPDAIPTGEYLRNLLSNQELTDEKVQGLENMIGDLNAKVDHLETELSNFKFNLARL